MSFSNNFIVKFEGTPVSVDDELVEFFCDEAQLPNINTATGSINGLYTGLGNVDYPHTKVFTELQLGFMLDSNLTLLKFLNDWYNKIFIETGGTSKNRVTRLEYYNSYAATIKITKSEIGPSSTTQRKPITYVLEGAYPYAIDAVPLQFGSSQITKVTAQFKYQRHYTTTSDVSGVEDAALKPSAVTKAATPTVTAADQEAAAEQPKNPTINPSNNEIGFTNGDNTWYPGADSASSPAAPLPPSTGTPLP